MNKLRVRKVYMLANGHPVFDTRIFVKEARSLEASGFEVSLIIPAASDDQRGSIRIIAIPPVRKGWQALLLNPWRILKKALLQPSDAVFVIHDSDILIAGIALKLAGRKVVYDAHEDTPLQISYQHWIPKFLRPFYGGMYFVIEKICGWLFDAIVVAEPVIARYFPSRKTYLVRNFPIADSFRNRPAPIAYASRKRRMSYIGTLSKVRGLFEMLEGARRAEKETDFEFFLGGKFAPADLEEKVVLSYRIHFSNWVPYEKLVEVLFDSRVGIIIPNPVRRYQTNYPVKLFEFMAAGLPVIASKYGESAAFVAEADCGLLVDPTNVDEIAKAIVYLFTNTQEAEAMGKRGQDLIFSKYNWENEKEVLIRLISSI